MNNISISLGKRQLVDSIWKSAGIEGLGTTFPDTECILDNLPVTLESNDSSELKQFFREKCLLLNLDYLPETQRTDNDSMDKYEI